MIINNVDLNIRITESFHSFSFFSKAGFWLYPPVNDTSFHIHVIHHVIRGGTPDQVNELLSELNTINNKN